MNNRYIKLAACALLMVNIICLCACQKDISDDSVGESSTNTEEQMTEFERLRKDNTDVRAWLTISGLNIEAPIMAHDTDNSFYNKRDSDGNESPKGAYYIDDYNSFDFTDPVTVVYGRNMSDGSMLGNMQESYSNSEFFEANNTFSIQTPDREYEYKVIAAVPYSNRHILYYHDFNSFLIVENFMEGIYNTRSLAAVVDTSVEIEEDDRICILSTGFDGDTQQRYLVIGVWKNNN